MRSGGKLTPTKTASSAIFVVDAGPSKNERVNRCVNNPSETIAISPVTPPEQRSGNTYPYSTAISLLPCGRWPVSGGAVSEEFGGKVHFVDLGSLTDPRQVAGPSRRQIQRATKSGFMVWPL
jgi:hypothetical protein